MNEYYVKVDFTKGRIATNLKKLVQNDYNSTKINFTFDKEGRVLFKMLYPDGTQYVDEILNNSLVFGAGILHQEGDYEYEISLYTEDGRLTDYATKSFEVRSELVNTDELVESDDRVPILDDLINDVNKNINEINNLNIDLKDSILTITRKDGTTYSENVKGEPGIQGKPGSVKTIPVNEFPTENIEEDAIYILPNPKPTSEKDKYLEYVYVNGDWELFGGGSVGVDLTNYPTKDEVNNITGNLEDLSTEDKSNIVNAINEVASNSGGNIPIYSLQLDSKQLQNFSGVYVTSDYNNQLLSQVVNDMVNKGGVFALNLGESTQTTYEYVYFGLISIVKGTQKTSYSTQLNCLFGVSDGNYIRTRGITINGEWNNNVFTCTSIYLGQRRELAQKNFVGVNGTQTIYGVKTFNALPESPVTPTTDKQLVNKKYVDDAIASLKAELSGGV